MRVEAIIDCVGLGYNLNKGETADLNKDLANKLIKFGYVEEVKVKKPKETKVKE